MAASGTIKGITVQIGADTSKLSDALHKADSAIKGTERNLKDVEKALKMNPGNMDLLRDKQNLLSDRIAETKQKLDALKQAQEKMDASGVDKNSKEYQDLQRQIDITKQKVADLTKEYDNFGSVAGQKLQAVGESLQNAGDKIAGVGASLSTKLTLPLAAAGAAGVKNFAEVDKTMQLANKTMGNTTEEAQLVNNAMKDAAANSTFGMQDAATATLNFARAGLDAQQSAAALAPAMNLAAGEGGDLNTVSSGLVATINGFHGSFDDASKYADVFASACNNSALDINSLSDAMSVAAPIFSSAGYSVNDAALYMGTMANNGIQADVAANSLKTGLARLVSPAKEGAEMMNQLGISVTNSDGSMKDSVTIQRDLHDAFGKLSESEQLAAASAIFGKNQMAPWLALINTAPSDVMSLNESLGSATVSMDGFAESLSNSGLSIDTMKANMEALGISSEAFDSALKGSQGNAELFAENLFEATDAGVTMDDVMSGLGTSMGDLQGIMDSAKGTTQSMADTMMSGFGGSIESLKSSVDVLGYSLGQSLAPYMQKVIDAAQGLVDKFNSLSPAQQDMIVKIGLVVAAIGPALVALGKTVSSVGTVISAIGKVPAAFNAVKTAFTVAGTAFKAFGAVLLANPIGIVVAVIATLVTAFVILWNKCEGFRNFWKGLWDGLKSVASGAVDGIKQGLSNMKEKFGEVKENVNQAVGAMKEHVKGRLTEMKQSFDENGGGIKGAVSAAWTGIKGYYQDGFQVVDNLTGGKLSGILGTFKSKMSDVASNVSSKLSDVKNHFTSKLGDANSTASTKLANIATTVSNKMGDVKTKVSDALDKVKGFFSDKLSSAKDTASTIFGNIADAAKDKANAMRDHFSDALNNIKDFFSNLKLELPDIKLPHFSLDGEFNLKEGKVPSLKVEWYDKGGIFSSPTVIGVGEKRPEFVGALDDLRAIVREESGGGNTALLKQMVGLMQALVSQERPIEVHQNIYAQDTSYAGQQREAARRLKEVAGALV